MTSTEVQKLTDKLMTLSRDVDYAGCDDPFRSFWLGFDTAVETFFKSIRDLLETGEWEEIREYVEKAEREISCTTYERAMRRTAKDVMSFVGE